MLKLENCATVERERERELHFYRSAFSFYFSGQKR